MIVFKKIDLITATRNEWNSYHKVRRQFYKEDFPNEPIVPDNSTEVYLKNSIKNYHMIRVNFLIFDDTKVIGSVEFYYYDPSSPSYKGNEKVMYFDIILLREYRRLGIGSSSLKMIAEYCEKVSKTNLIAESQVSEVREFITAIGGKIALIFAKSKLLFKDIDMNLMSSWIEEAEQKNPGSKAIIIEGKMPDEYIKEYVNCYNLSGRDEPKGELEEGDELLTVEVIRNEEKEFERSGIKVFKGLIIEKDGKISALSIVKMYPGIEKHLRQSFTGVGGPYQGRKLGKWVKAKMIAYIKTHYPETETLVTGNASSNGPMLRINTSMGYKKFKEEIVGQIKIEEVKKYLQSKSITDPILTTSNY